MLAFLFENRIAKSLCLIGGLIGLIVVLYLWKDNQEQVIHTQPSPLGKGDHLWWMRC